MSSVSDDLPAFPYAALVKRLTVLGMFGLAFLPGCGGGSAHETVNTTHLRSSIHATKTPKGETAATMIVKDCSRVNECRPRRLKRGSAGVFYLVRCIKHSGDCSRQFKHAMERLKAKGIHMGKRSNLRLGIEYAPPRRADPELWARRHHWLRRKCRRELRMARQIDRHQAKPGEADYWVAARC
jgi:hypothetical protein